MVNSNLKWKWDQMKMEKGGELIIPTCFVITGYSICMPCDVKRIPTNYPIVVIQVFALNEQNQWG